MIRSALFLAMLAAAQPPLTKGQSASATPSWTLAASQPTASAAKPNSVAIGSYECWAFSSARMGLNFRILDGKRYSDSESKSGTYSYDAGSGRITFRGGLLEDAMPTGFYSIYHEPKGRPTVSFRSARDVEASFCEKI